MGTRRKIYARIIFLLIPIVIITMGVGWFLYVDKTVQMWVTNIFRVFTISIISLFFYFIFLAVLGNANKIKSILKEKNQ